MKVRSMATTPSTGKPRITFLSYWREEEHFFRTLLPCLPGDVAAEILSVRTRSLARLIQYLTPPCLPSHVTDADLDAMIRMDLRERLAQHPDDDATAVRRRLRRRAKQWLPYFEYALRGTDLLVVWNGFQTTKQAALAAARRRGCKTAFLELGAIPQTLAVDPRGINFNNSLSGKPAEFFRAQPVDPARAEELLHSTFAQRALRKAATPVPDYDEDMHRLPARFLLFAMQVYDDSQLLMFSPRFSTMSDAITYVHDELARYRERTGDDLRLVVKEHPSDYGRADYAPLREALPDVIFLRRAPVQELLKGAAAVLTINSSVGIEALLHMRRVITLGDAFYNVPGLVRHLEAHEALADVLAETLARPVDTELITRYLYFLRYRFLVPGSYYTDDARTLQPVADRLLEILHDRPPW